MGGAERRGGEKRDAAETKGREGNKTAACPSNAVSRLSSSFDFGKGVFCNYWCNAWCIRTFVTKVLACRFARCSRADWCPTADSASEPHTTEPGGCRIEVGCSPVSLLGGRDDALARCSGMASFRSPAQRIMRLTSKTECTPRMIKGLAVQSHRLSWLLASFPASFSPSSTASQPRASVNPGPAPSTTPLPLHSITRCDAGAPQHMSLNANPARTGRCFRNLEPGSLPAGVAFKFLSLGFSSSP